MKTSRKRTPRSAKPTLTKKDIDYVFQLMEMLSADVHAVESLTKTEMEVKNSHAQLDAAIHLLSMAEQKVGVLYQDLTDRFETHGAPIYKLPDTVTIDISPEDLTTFTEAIVPARSLLALTSDHRGELTASTIHSLTFSALCVADQIQARLSERLGASKESEAQ